MRRSIKVLTVILLIFATASVSFFIGLNTASTSYYQQGVTDTLTKVANLLQTKGVTLDWKQTADGYTITISTVGGQSATLNLAMNLYITHRDKYGNLISSERGAGTFTNLGKNFTINQILYSAANIAGFVSGGGTSGIPITGSTGSNTTTALLYLGDATTAGSSATSLVQPTETQLDGMARVKETSAYYSAGTGIGTIGQFNCTVTKTCSSAGITVTEWGLYYGAYATDPNTLVAYDSTPGSKNLAVGDTLQETWTGTFS